MKTTVGLALSLVASVLPMASAIAEDSLQVKCGDVAGLIDAVNAANANSVNQTTAISLNADNKLECVYRLTSAYGSTGDGLPPVSSNVTIDGNGSIIEGSGDGFRIVEVVATAGQLPGGVLLSSDFKRPASLTLIDLTLTGGTGPTSPAHAKCPPIVSLHFQRPELALGNCGGAAFNVGTLRLIDVTVAGNQAVFGAGIFNAGSLSLLRTSVSSGYSDGEGAGIYNLGDLVMTDSSITGNQSTSHGGGVLNHGTLTATGSSFANNSGWSGGGIYTDGVAQLRTSKVLGNTAVAADGSYTSYGAGIYSAGVTSMTESLVEGNSATFISGGIHQQGGELTIDSSTIRRNSAMNGVGGLSIGNYGSSVARSPSLGNLSIGGRARITNSFVVDNTTRGFGGGIDNDVDLQVTGSTISGNSATWGAGISNARNGRLVLSDVTLENNSAGDSGGAIYNRDGYVIGHDISLLRNSADALGGGIFNYDQQAVTTLVLGSVVGNQAALGGGGIYNADGSVAATAGTEFSGNGPNDCEGVVIGC